MKEWIYGALISFCFIVVLGAAYLPNTVVQVFAPDGRKTVSLTAASTTTDTTKWTAVHISSPVDAYRRHMPAASSNKALYPQVPIYGQVSVMLGVNSATPFLNISGATGGVLEGM